jgi:hypothetical protein
MPRSVLDERETRWAVDCRETHVRDLVVYLGYNRIPDGLFVLRPERKRPLRALRLTALDPAALPTSDIEDWLSRRAPQIHRLAEPRLPAGCRGTRAVTGSIWRRFAGSDSAFGMRMLCASDGAELLAIRRASRR